MRPRQQLLQHILSQLSQRDERLAFRCTSKTDALLLRRALYKALKAKGLIGIRIEVDGALLVLKPPHSPVLRQEPIP